MAVLGPPGPRAPASRWPTLLGGTRTEILSGVSLGIEPTVDGLLDRSIATSARAIAASSSRSAPGRDVQYVDAVRER